MRDRLPGFVFAVAFRRIVLEMIIDIHIIPHRITRTTDCSAPGTDRTVHNRIHACNYFFTNAGRSRILRRGEYSRPSAYICKIVYINCPPVKLNFRYFLSVIIFAAVLQNTADCYIIGSISNIFEKINCKYNSIIRTLSTSHT